MVESSKLSSKNILNLLREDLNYINAVRDFKRADEDVDSWIDELMSLQASRAIRSLNTTALLQDSIYQVLSSTINNQAARSRAVEIQMHALQKEILIEDRVSKLKKYFLVEYAPELKVYKTINERKNLIDEVLSKLSVKVNRLKSVNKMAELLINDATQAGFTIQRINEVLAKKAYDK